MIRQYDLIAPCHFGMESVLKNEIYDIGYEITEIEDGRVTFAGDAEAIVRANICLRTAERVLLKVGSFTATTFDELYEGTKAIPWEEYLPRDAKFWVTKAASVKSKLFSPSDIQSVMKKAMVDRMHVAYGISNFPETGSSYPIRVFIKKDIVTVGIDTTGESLHKRGYRHAQVKAPIAENLAAGLIMLTPWHAGRILVDPFCGSGTIPIEAAMIAANIAPGLKRTFTSMDWTNLIPTSLWNDVKEEAQDEIDLSVQTDLQGYDIDPQAVAAARENARAAGVDSLIHFQVRPVSALSHPKKYGFIITNPPYGKRLSDSAHGGDLYPTGSHPKEERLARTEAEEEMSAEEIEKIYETLGERYKALNSWSMYVISAYPDTERALGLKAAKNRKIYNGMIKTYFYMFPGPKPPARRGGAQ